jgi:hypothetical protein
MIASMSSSSLSKDDSRLWHSEIHAGLSEAEGLLRGLCPRRPPRLPLLFETGRSDGFSPEDVALFLTVTETICPKIADDQFPNVTRLGRDVGTGRFPEAFPA